MKGIIAFIFTFGYLNIVASTRTNGKMHRLLILLHDLKGFDYMGRRVNIFELPEADKLLPGHTLIRPTNSMLKSAIKYPLDAKKLVYVNLENVGVTDQNTMKILALNKRIQGLQTNLSLKQKTNYIEDFLNNQGLAVNNKTLLNEISVHEEENNANEILDRYSLEDDDADGYWHPGFRRFSKKNKKKKRNNRDSKYLSDEHSDSFVSASSDYEKNPGNPYTTHREKYKQNWMWNHNMDGNHMNVNPLGPQFANTGPSGADLFFGRKWWYYNQDDYKPMG